MQRTADRTETCQVLETALAEGQLSMADEAILAGPDPTNDHSKLIYSFTRGWGDLLHQDPVRHRRHARPRRFRRASGGRRPCGRAGNPAHRTRRRLGDASIDIDHVAEPPGPGALELLVKVTTTSGADGFIYLDGASNIKRVEYPG